MDLQKTNKCLYVDIGITKKSGTSRSKTRNANQQRHTYERNLFNLAVENF